MKNVFNEMYHLDKLLFIYALIVIISSAPVTDKKNDVTLDSYEFKQLNENNQYSFAYKTSDGQSRDEIGTFKTDEKGDARIHSVEGSFQYYGPDGIFYNVWYTADENGFHPKGFHLPGATPPVPVVPYLGANAIKSLIG